MSTYNLTTTFIPIKEKQGIINNVSDVNIEWAITKGKAPQPGEGTILAAKHTRKFNITTGSDPTAFYPPPPPPYGHKPYPGYYADPPHPHSQPPHMREYTLYIRACSMPADTIHPVKILVNGYNDDGSVRYNISGLTDWAAVTVYDIGEFVCYNKQIWRCNKPHTSSAVFDGSDFWDLITGNGVSKLEYDNTTNIITVEYSDSTSGTIAIDKVAGASLADEATHATKADKASLADLATHATAADTATFADDADHATSADSATNATNAVNAQKATKATSADYATTAGTATSATSALNADNSAHATLADRAVTADTAGRANTATNATTADTATYADRAGVAVTAEKADNADNAVNAQTATKARVADTATQAIQDSLGNVIATTYAKAYDIATYQQVQGII